MDHNQWTMMNFMKMENNIIMIIQIEYYQGDTLLYGKQVSYAEFLRQLNEIESDYDREQDNFIPLLRRRYGWMIIETSDIPAYVYDRDIRRAYQVKRD